jgi:hypothetical protein
LDERRLAFYRSTVHPLLSVLAPFLFLWTLTACFRGIILPIPAPPIGSLVVVLAAGVVEAVSSNALSRGRSGGVLVRFREIVLVLVGAEVVLVMLSGALLQGRFAPLAPGIVVALVLVLAQWVISLAVHGTLRERERYLKLVAGKTGVDLKNAVRDAFEEASVSANGLRSLKRLIIGFQVALFLLFLVAEIVTNDANAGLKILTAAFECAGVGFVSLLNYFLREQTLFGDGIVMEGRIGSRHVTGAAATIVILLAVALLVSGRQSLFPTSYPSAVLGALDRFFSRQVTIDTRNAYRGAPAANPQDQGKALQESLGNVGGSSHESSAAAVVRILGYAVGILVGAGFLYFLLRPLFTRSGRGRLRDLHPLRSLAAGIRTFGRSLGKAAAALVSLLRTPRRSVGLVTRAIAKGLRDAAGRVREARSPSAAEERAQGRRQGVIVREYVRLIRWGEKTGIAFHKSMGPHAYAGLLGDAAPEKRQDIAMVASLFEEFMYSGSQADPQRFARFRKSIDGILRHPTSRSER